MNKIDSVKLDNGLTIYLYNDNRRHSTFFNLVTLCGGYTKDFIVNNKEYHLQDGLAHVLEHYIVECNDKGNFLKELGESQMSTNASTSTLMTSYYFETVENVLFGVRTILEGVNNVKFDKDKLEKLKNPIFQEIRSKLDNKFYHLGRRRFNNLFKNIDFRDIGGLVDEVRDTTIDDLEVLYNYFYHPSNQFIVVAGNFDRDSVLYEIKDFYKDKKYKKINVKMINYNEDISVNKKNDIIHFPTPEDYTELSFKIDISNYDPKYLLNLDFYIGCFFDNYFGITSKLHKELINKCIITDCINCSDNKIDKYLVINIGAFTSDSNKFKKYILDVINDNSLFSEESFDLFKKNSYVSLILREENIFKVIFPFIDNVVYFNYPYMDTLDDFKEFTYNNYVDYISKLDFNNYISITIRNDKAVH